MKNKILVVLPTRGRPWAALEAITSVMKNSSGLADLIYCCDHDDPATFILETPRVKRWYAPRRSFGQWVNAVVRSNLNDYDWFAWCADDIRFLTPDWDQKVVAHPELVVYGPDNIQNEKMATHPFFRARLPQALGFVTPPMLLHGCLDTFVQGVARELHSIVYDSEIKMDHLHHSVGRNPVDATYLDVDWARDVAEWTHKIQPRLGEYAARVSAYLSQ